METLCKVHSAYWGIKPPFFFVKPPPLNLQTVQAPFLGISPIYWFFVNLHNIQIFHP